MSSAWLLQSASQRVALISVICCSHDHCVSKQASKQRPVADNDWCGFDTTTAYLSSSMSLIHLYVSTLVSRSHCCSLHAVSSLSSFTPSCQVSRVLLLVSPLHVCSVYYRLSGPSTCRVVMASFHALSPLVLLWSTLLMSILLAPVLALPPPLVLALVLEAALCPCPVVCCPTSACVCRAWSTALCLARLVATMRGPRLTNTSTSTPSASPSSACHSSGQQQQQHNNNNNKHSTYPTLDGRA